MPRLSSSELDRLKQSVSLVALLESEGYKLKKQGKDYVMLCPFHQEKTPSFSVSVAKNCYHCFGCDARGSVLDYVMQSQRISMGKAISHLQALNPSLAAPAPKPDPVPAPAVLMDTDDDGQVLLHQVVEFYHQQLLQSPEAKDWLVRRGLDNAELVSHFRLGYAGRHGVSAVTGSRTRNSGQQVRTRLRDLGVLREATGQDHFRGCVIMPVIGDGNAFEPGHRGKVLQLYGRRTIPDHALKKNSLKHLYLARPLAGVWNEASLVNNDTVILCEALIDAMTFWCAGYRNVISSYGVNGFTDGHLAALLHHGVKEVLIAYDRDEAGDKAAESLALRLAGQGVGASRVIFPRGMDANEYALKSGMPAQALGRVLEQAARISEAGHGEERRPEGVISVTVPADMADYQIPAAGELQVNFGSRQWRVRGWHKNSSPEVMKVNVQVRHGETGAFHVDSLDIYNARQRHSYITQAAQETGSEADIIKRDMGRLLLRLEQLQDEALTAALNPQPVAVTVSGEAQSAALTLLKSSSLAEQIASDLNACGVVGESSNLLVGYLAAVSRKLDRPLAILIQSSSSAGKSSLMDAVLSLMPEEERVQYSAMTGQSLFYLGENNLQHRILAIAEEEGVRQAAYALKLLQSDGELTIASTGKDESSGELVTREYHVRGPVMLMLTTTAIDIDEELLNRCLVLSVNESREQTQAIHDLQRYQQTLDGLLAQNEREYLTELHQNAQRLLRPLKVVNPYARELTFLSDKTRTRRDHMKYLTLIQSITLLHQYQREIKTVSHRGKTLDYIEVALSDIALANRLAHEVLGRTLDELPPQSRRLLLLIQQMVGDAAERESCQAAGVRFSRRDIREYTQWSDNQLKVHCQRLVEMEYLLVRSGCRGQLMLYELLWSGEDDDQSRLAGLLDVAALSPKATKKTQGNRGKLESPDKKLERDGEKLVSSCAVVGGRLELDNPPQSQSAEGVNGNAVGVDGKKEIKHRRKSPAALPPVTDVSH